MSRADELVRRLGDAQRLNQLVSRTASFPLAVATRFVETYSMAGARVLDPFVGKGTTLLAARLLGRHGYGIDIAPEAVLITRAKLVRIKLADVLEYVDDLPIEPADDTRGIPRDVRAYYSRRTLLQLLAVRARLLRDILSADSDIRSRAQVTMACLLGIMHGHSAISLSVPSAHAYAMAPSYVRRYIREHKIARPNRDVRECLREKARRCVPSESLPEFEGDAQVGNATNTASIYPKLAGTVDLILTSPPYLDAQTYAKDNWLRLWALGYDYKSLAGDYLQTGSVSLYRTKMSAIFASITPMLKPGGRLVCISGDVRAQGKVIETGRVLQEVLKAGENGMQLEASEVHKVASHNRYLHAIHKSNGHQERSLTERVFVAQKVGEA